MKTKTNLKNIINNSINLNSSAYDNMNSSLHSSLSGGGRVSNKDYNKITIESDMGLQEGGSNTIEETEIVKKQLDKLYTTVVLEESINLTAKETNYDINSIIINKLRSKIEGKCIKEGYVRKNSLKIVSRTMGLLINSDFNSAANFIVKYSSDVCVIGNNQIIECEVHSVDKSQIICYIGDSNISPVEIYLFKQHHIGDENYMNLQENDTIRIQAIKSRYEYNDKQIVVLGKFLEKV